MSNSMVRCYAKEGNVKLMRRYLDNTNVDDVENFDGCNVLPAAVDGDQIECVQALLEYSLDINKKTKKTKDRYPIRDERWTKLLIPCIYASDWRRPNYSTTQTALHIACRKNHSEIAKLLLQHHADPNILDDRSLTPLCAALLCYSAACVNVLLDFGVPLGYAASVAALRKNDLALRKMTLRYPFEDFWFTYHKTDRKVILDPLSSAACAEHLESMQLLLDYAAEAKKDVVNAIGFAGKTPIMYAENVKCLKVLLKHGANVNIACSAGRVALYYAISSYREDSARLIMERTDFAKVKRLKRQGEVLVQAIHSQMRGIVEHLLEKGFKVEVEAEAEVDRYCEITDPDQHYTPLMAAIQAGDEKSMNMVLQRGADMNHWLWMNPVTEMIDRGTETMAWQMIHAGLDVNGVSFDGHCRDYYETDEISEYEVQRKMLELFLKAGVRCVSELAEYCMVEWWFGMDRNKQLSRLVRKYGRQRDWIEFADQWDEDGEIWKSLSSLRDEVCSLKELCRLEVRHSLMDTGKHTSMFKVEFGALGLPERMRDYLLYVEV